MAKIRPRKKLEALSINEEVGDIPTHYFKSGSSIRPKEQLQDLNAFKTYLLPEELEVQHLSMMYGLILTKM